MSPAAPRHIVITGAGYPDKSRKVAFVSTSGKLWLSRKSGSLDRFDLVRATSLDDQLRPMHSFDAHVEQERAASAWRFLAPGAP